MAYESSQARGRSTSLLSFIFSWLHLPHLEVPGNTGSKPTGQWEFLFFFFLLFFGGRGACGGSQARGSVGATAAGLAIATATQDWIRVYDLHHSPWHCQIHNPLREARDRICNFMVPSRVHFHCATTEILGTPFFF